jgi:hypothetical protein
VLSIMFLSQNVLPIMFFSRMRCQLCFSTEYADNHVFFPRLCCHSCFSPECAANHVLVPECAANHVVPLNVLLIIFSPEFALNHGFP